MSEKGVGSVVALSVLLILFIVSMSVLSFSQRQNAKAFRRLTESRSLFMAHGAAVVAMRSRFEKPEMKINFQHGTVEMTRTYFQPDEKARIQCHVRFGKVSRVFEMDWQKKGGQWVAESWREKT